MSMYCEPLLAALKECLLQSDCVVKQGNLPSDCLRNHTKELPEQCLSLRQATFECKRGMVRNMLSTAVASRLCIFETISWICENDFEGTMRGPSLRRSRGPALAPLQIVDSNVIWVVRIQQYHSTPEVRCLWPMITYCGYDSYGPTAIS